MARVEAVVFTAGAAMLVEARDLIAAFQAMIRNRSPANLDLHSRRALDEPPSLIAAGPRKPGRGAPIGYVKKLNLHWRLTEKSDRNSCEFA